MSKILSITAAALIAASAFASIPASAAPVYAPGLKTAAPLLVDEVRSRRGWGGAAAGFAAGAIFGGLLARPYYGYPYGYGYYPGGYGYYPGPVYAAPPPVYMDDAIDYCMRRFRSYDPASGTYRGYDGYRHPCP